MRRFDRRTVYARAMSSIPAPTITPLLDRKAVAEILNVSLRKVDYLTATGSIKVVRLGKAVRFTQAAISSFVEASQK